MLIQSQHIRTYTKKPTAAEIEVLLIAQISERSGRPPDDIDIREPFVYHGLNSKQVVSMSGDLRIGLGDSLLSTLDFDYANIESIALYLARDDVVQSYPDNKQTVLGGLSCQQVKQAHIEQSYSQKEERSAGLSPCSLQFHKIGTVAKTASAPDEGTCCYYWHGSPACRNLP